MGVHGLWKLLEPAGKAVALESLQSKVLGVDVSIWLHQVLKGFQDSQGSPVPNAHLLGLFHRICKLLFYRIKPVFVFDGGVPILKKKTIAARKKQKGRAARDAERVREQLLKNLVKHKAVRRVLGEKASRNVVADDHSRKDENLFHLPPMLDDLDVTVINSSDSEASVKYEPSEGESDADQDIKYLSPSKAYAMNLDLHTLDVKNENFRALPADVRHDILSDLKETRKQNSWGRLHEMPKESTDFSSFQLGRLLKRRSVQVSLEEAEKEMGGKVLSMAELEDIMNAQGVKLEDDSRTKDSQLNPFSRRIASDVATRYVLISESSKQVEPTSSDKVEAKSEETKTEILETKVKIKKEYEDDWSSDDDADKVERQKVPEVKIKQETCNWSSDEESTISEQKLVKQYLTAEDGVTQEEIFALIENERSQVAHRSDDPSNIPGTSRDRVVFSASSGRTALPTRTDSDNDFDQILPVQAATPSSSAEKILQQTRSVVTGEINTKSKNSIPTLFDRSQNDGTGDGISADILTEGKPVQERAEKDDKLEFQNDENQMAVLKSKRTAGASTIKREETSPELKKDQGDVKLEGKSIEVIIDNCQNYNLEEDIFADIFPDQGTAEEMSKLLLKETEVNSGKAKNFGAVGTKKEEKGMPPKNEIESQAKNSSSKVTGELAEHKIQNGAESKTKMNLEKNASSVVRQKHIDGENEGLSMLAAADDSFDDDDDDDGAGEDDESMPGTSQQAKELVVSPMSSEKLQLLETALEEKHERLIAERGRQERLAASITDQMCSEAQELLRLFGVPYVVAPMEAEAQCAFLDALSLTEGTITDDSDIWLFGGRKVYKNFFNQKKHVLQYTSATIQHYLKLERHHMVLLALLVGSDYTAGLEGVGPVTAMEVLAAFPPGKETNLAENREALLEGLRRFRDWWQAGRPMRSVRTQQLKNKVKDVHFYEGFPSLAVVDAYLRPTIDESREAFSWGDLDMQGLREFARVKFGWAQSKVDEILLPVAKRVAERKNQRFIDSYFNVMPHFKEGEQKMSKRVKRAVDRMDNEDEDNVDDPEPRSSPPKKRKAGTRRQKRRGDKTTSDEESSQAEGLSMAMQPSASVPSNDEDNQDAGTQTTLPETHKRIVSQKSEEQKRADFASCEAGKDRERKKRSSAPKKTAVKRPTNDEGQDPCEEGTTAQDAAVLLAKRSKKNDDGSGREEGPKPRPRQRTHSGVVRTGVKGPPKKSNRDVHPQSTGSSSSDDHVSSANVEKKAASKRSHPAKTNTDRKSAGGRGSLNAGREPPLDPISEGEEEEENMMSPIQSTSLGGENLSQAQTELEPKPGTSSDYKESGDLGEEPDEEEEAMLAALHAMDWDDDPWGGFQPPREKVFFGGIRKNPAPRTRRPREPAPPPAAQPVDNRGYRPGTRTLERIESRLTHPQLEWNSPASHIPQREKDRQQAEESKMRAIKLFKASGAMKTVKLLGEDSGGTSKRRAKKKKVAAKVTELDLSEESSDD